MTASSPSAARAAVDELERLLAKATPGPWGAYWGDQIGGQVEHLDGGAVRVKFSVAELSDEYDREDEGNEADAAADAALIAAAVNALPHLLAAIKAVDELCDQAEARRDLRRWLGAPETKPPAEIKVTTLRAALALAAVDVTETAE